MTHKSTQRIHYRNDVATLRYFFDCEFIDTGATLELLSLAVVCEDGREFYAVNSEADHSHASPWVHQNVLPHLGDGPHMTRREIAVNLFAFFSNVMVKAPELWGWYGAYDWVLFCQLFGPMIHLPKHLPQFPMDLKQLALMLGNPTLPKQKTTLHNALEDARWNREVFYFLRGLR